MILADPKVVILDEATSALDTATETKLHQALKEFLSHKTTLIIAHRLSTIKQAERVLIFEEGQLVELNSYEQLFFEKN
jgi:ATP-binding cassette subfamily C protein